MWEYDYLCHHGIKGQKWGVRRFQNEDGTLTEAGRKKYSRQINRGLRKAVRNKVRTDADYMEADREAQKILRNRDKRIAVLEKAERARIDKRYVDDQVAAYLKQAKDLGLTVQSKDVLKTARVGKLVGYSLLGGPIGVMTATALAQKHYGNRYSESYNGKMFNQTPYQVVKRKYTVS